MKDKIFFNAERYFHNELAFLYQNEDRRTTAVKIS